MSNKKWAVALATLLMTGIAGSAYAGETAPAFDAAKCKVPYPKAALMNEEEGMTTLSLFVNTEGTVTDSKLEKSSGFKDLDKAAQKGLSDCKFKPGTKDGAPVATWTKVEYAWKMQ